MKVGSRSTCHRSRGHSPILSNSLKSRHLGKISDRAVKHGAWVSTVHTVGRVTALSQWFGRWQLSRRTIPSAPPTHRSNSDLASCQICAYHTNHREDWEYFRRAEQRHMGVVLARIRQTMHRNVFFISRPAVLGVVMLQLTNLFDNRCTTLQASE